MVKHRQKWVLFQFASRGDAISRPGVVPEMPPFRTRSAPLQATGVTGEKGCFVPWNFHEIYHDIIWKHMKSWLKSGGSWSSDFSHDNSVIREIYLHFHTHPYLMICGPWNSRGNFTFLDMFGVLHGFFASGVILFGNLWEITSFIDDFTIEASIRKGISQQFIYWRVASKYVMRGPGVDQWASLGLAQVPIVWCEETGFPRVSHLMALGEWFLTFDASNLTAGLFYHLCLDVVPGPMRYFHR